MFLVLVLQFEPLPPRCCPDIQNLSLEMAAIMQLEYHWPPLQGCKLQGAVQGTTDRQIGI